MANTSTYLRRLRSVRLYSLFIAIAWTLAIVAGASISIHQVYHGTLQAVRIQAAQSFEKDLVYRRWAASHGGVYVPVTEQTPPNPYLSHIANRDFEIDGTSLTLVNPAYMTRQVIELAREQYGHEGHITSLDPLRPENAADSWEAEALRSFEDGKTEASAVVTLNDSEYFRLMRPMTTEESCLKCHAIQGYEVGDIRGGISVSIPMDEHMSIAYGEAASAGIWYSVIWFLGIGGLGISASHLGKHITHRTHAEERATNLGAMLEQSANEVYVFDPQTLKFVDVSATARRNTGYSLDEFLEMTPVDLKREFTKESFKELLAPLGAGADSVVDVSSTHRRKDGTAYPVAAHIQLLAFGGKPAYIAIIIDTTERVRALEEREHLLAHLQHSQRLESIGTLASGVAHEINNPLMGMMNYAELAKDTAKNPKEIEYLQEIGNEGNRIAGIVHSLLSFSRQDKGEFQLSSIGEIIDESLKLIGSLLRKNMIVLDLNISDSLPLISGRKQQLQQVVINLITNSVDALNQRYPESDDNKILRISASVLPEQPADSVRVSVEDHGAGISEDKILRIFDPFFTTKDRAKGTGLGLSVSFGIVREHNGQLNVTSKVGEFTRFDIDLPINGEGQDSKGSHSCRPEDLAKPTQ